jgi:hypothetical protein
VLEFHAAGWGFNGGDATLVTLPGGMQIHPYYASINHVLAPAHPLAAGVPASFGGSPSHAWFSAIPAGATSIAADDLGHPNLVEYRFGAGTVIAGGQTFEYGYAFGEVVGQILANMIPYAANLESWLTIVPASGTVAAGESALLTLTFDAAGLLGGDYATAVRITSNDPDEPEVTVPAQLHVTGVPDIVLGGPEIAVESAHVYSTYGALTQHTLNIPVPPPSAAGVFELIAEGAFGFAGQTATLSAEGQLLGSTIPTGDDPSSPAWPATASSTPRSRTRSP